MRCWPNFSESSFSLSFFLTTPAKKPRTECGCQPVASTMAAIVVPLAWRSISSTVSCFDGERLPGCAEAARFTVFGSGLRAVILVARAPLGAHLMPRDGFAVCLFDFCLLVAIRPSLVSTTASRAATDTSPAIRLGNGKGEAAVRWRLSGPPHTLLSTQKSSELSSNLWLFAPTNQAY